MKFAPGDSRTELRINKFFQKLAPARVGLEEFWLSIRGMARGGFAPEKIAKVRSLIDSCDKNDDALFLAKRALNHEIDMALAQPENRGAATQARIKQIGADLVAQLDAKLQGRFDRYSKRQELRALRHDGKLDGREFAALQATLATSTTLEQYSVGVLHAWVALRQTTLQIALDEAWEDAWKTISENMTGDLRDAQGHIIETVGEQQLKELLRRREIEHVKLAPKVREALEIHAWLGGIEQLALSALCGEPDPARRVDLQATLASVEAGRAQVRPGPGIPR